MGVLGKDIFDLSRPRTSTRVRFGEEGYWVEDVPEMQAYGSTLTEILNLDLASFQAAVGAVDQVIEKRDSDAAPRAFMDLCGAVGSLPLYRLYREDLRFFGKMQAEQFVVGEARDAFGEFVLEGDSRLLPRSRSGMDGSWGGCPRGRWWKRKRARGKNLWPSRCWRGIWSPM